MFWRADQRLRMTGLAGGPAPDVVVIVPARDEAAVIAGSLRTILAQDYAGRLDVILVDDHSTDGTAAVAKTLDPAGERLTVVRAEALPRGWSGKVWAMAAGVCHAAVAHPDAAYYLFTDADVHHDPHALRALVGKAEAEALSLVSLMVMLDARGPWARLLIPAFVSFFRNSARSPGSTIAGPAQPRRPAAVC